MNTKKTAAKKSAAKTKTAAKPAAAKKTAAKKTPAKTNAADASVRLLSTTRKPSERRPPDNPNMPQDMIENLNTYLNEGIYILEDYAAHLRALDRKRLNGVGIKKQGFIDRALALAEENPEFLPHYLTLEKFRDDDEYFIAFRALFDLNRQISELLWNVVIEASDIVYTDALEFYASVREAAKRRVDAAESIHSELARFFKRTGRNSEEPTAKQLKRDVNALLSGKRDGKIVIENVKPKAVAGKRKVVDKKFADSVKLKDTDGYEYED